MLNDQMSLTDRRDIKLKPAYQLHQLLIATGRRPN